MIFQNLSNITPPDLIIMVIMVVVIIAFYFSGIFLIIKAKGKPERLRKYLFGISIFFILFGTGRVIMTLFEFFFDPFVWNIDINEFDAIFVANPDLFIIHDIVWRFTTTFGSLGLVFFIFQLENYILEKKTKFIFSILQVITVIPAVLFGTAGKDAIGPVIIILYIGNFLVIVVPFFYFYLAIKSTGITRKRAISAGIGMLIFFAGIVFNSSLGKGLFNNPFGIPGLHFSYYLFGILVCLGLAIYLKSLQY